MKKTVGSTPQAAAAAAKRKRSEVVPVKRLTIPCQKRRRASNLYLSTKLSLYDQTWPPNPKPYYFETPTPPEEEEEEEEDEEVKNKIREMKYYTREEEEEERRIGVSTKLKLFEYPWKITKVLTVSDLGNLSRLLLSTSLVENYVMPSLDDASRDEVGTEGGLRVTVWDFDTDSIHGLVFKKWWTSKSYVFVNNWVRDFVKRRHLAAGDEIGMCWDAFYSRFHFSVLNRAAPDHPHPHHGP